MWWWKKNRKPKQSAFAGTAFADDKVDFIDWSKKHAPAVKPMTIQKFRHIKHDIGRTGLPNTYIMAWHNISQTTFYLVKQAKNFKQYKALRLKASTTNSNLKHRGAKNGTANRSNGHKRTSKAR